MQRVSLHFRKSIIIIIIIIEFHSGSIRNKAHENDETHKITVNKEPTHYV